MMLALTVIFLTISLLAVVSNTVTVTAFAQADSQEQSNYQFMVWPRQSEFSDSWYTAIQVRICPDPYVSFIPESATGSDGSVVDPKTGIRIAPNVVTVSFNIAMVDGAREPIILNEYYGPENDFCNSEVVAYFEPEGAGVWQIQAKAEWISASDSIEIQRLVSNTARVTVGQPIFETRNSKDILLPVPVQQLHDWSPDGKSILITYPEDVQNATFSGSVGTNLGLMDSETYKISKVDFPKQFSDIYNARFSSSGSEILFLAHYSLYEPLQIFKYRLEGSDLVQLSNNTNRRSDGSALWVSGGGAADGNDTDRIIYDQVERDDSGNAIRYKLWLADSDGSKAKKLFERQLGLNEAIVVNDVSKDGKYLLMTFEKGLEAPTVLFNLTLFEIETGEFWTIATNSDGVGGGYARFSPAGDLVLHTTPGGYHTPGGPIVLLSADRSIHERIRVGETGMADSPRTFVVSPDGQSIITLVSQLGSGQSYLTRAEFIHPIPEFSTGLALLIWMLPILAFMIISNLRPGYWNKENKYR